MKTILLTMAALSGLSVAAPAAAQPWNSHRTQSAELQTWIDEGVQSGAISRRELRPLRDSLQQLVMLERQFSDQGISGREHAVLQQRSASLRQQIHMAQGPGNGRHDDDRRTTWEDSYDREHRAGWEDRYLRDRDAAWASRFGRDDRFGANARFDRPNRGDRFAGDVRIGQRSSVRMGALPEQFHEEFRDDDDVYYRYDDRRIYQVDRRTDLILGLIDILN